MKHLSLLDMKVSKKVPSPSKARTPPVVSPVEKVLDKSVVLSPQAPAKAPDPKPSPSKPLFSYQALLNQPYDLQTFARISSIAANSKHVGTEQFESFVAEFEYKFEEPAERFNWPMNFDRKTSWAEGAERLFEYCENDLGRFEKYLNQAWDRKKLESESEQEKHNNWNLRKFTHAIASQDPTVLFQIDEERPDLSPQFQNTFWDYTGWFNPKFKVDAHPLSQMWILCSHSFGHPWAVKDSNPAAVIYKERKQRQRLVRANKKQRARKRAQIQNQPSDKDFDSENSRAKAPVPPRTPDKHGVRFRVDGEVLERETEGSCTNNTDHDVIMKDSYEGGQQAVVSPPKRSFKNWRNQSFEKVLDAGSGSPSMVATGPSEKQGEMTFSKISCNGDFDDEYSDLPGLLAHHERDVDDDDSDDEDYAPPLREPVKDHVLEVSLDPIDDDEVQALIRRSELEESECNDDDDSDEENEWMDEDHGFGNPSFPSIPDPPNMRRAYNAPELREPDPTVQRVVNQRSESVASHSPNRSFRDVAAAPPPPPPPGRPLSDDERVAWLIQPNIEGLPIQNMRIVNVNISFSHNGSGSGKNSIAQVCLKEVQEFLSTLFQNRDQKFKLMPLSDTKYRNQKLWIDTREKALQKLNQWAALKPCMDLVNGNAEWITSQGKQAGQKTLRTRMRFAFDDNEEGAIATISGILEENGGSCLRSPLQLGDMVRSGFLPFWPLGMSRPVIERAFMRALGFEHAVGLGLDWAAMPTTRRVTWKAGQGSPGVRLWHVYVDGKHAREIDSRLRMWLHPNTPKRDFPYAAITQYCHDWKAVSRNRLSVNPYGPVRELITTMITRSVDFNSVTETFCSPIPIPGMLKVVETEKFGKTSLLRFLLSIKATPLQADSANGASGPTDEDEGDDASPQESTQDISSRVASGEDPEVKLRAATEEALFAGRPGALEAARRAELVRKKDLANTDASALFQLIMPETMPQFYLFTSHLRSLQLANNVVDGLCAFIIAHLEESDRRREAYILRTWLGAAEYTRVRNRNIIWDGEEMRARVASANGNERVDQGLDWLDFGRDVTDQAQGFLEIDMDLADIRDIDDGATVAGAVDELRRAEGRIEEMIQEIHIHQDENAQLRARVAELEALRASAQPPADDAGRASSGRSGSRRNGSLADRGGGSSTTRP